MPTYSLLETKTLNSNSGNISFTNIPSIYTDLVFHLSLRSDRSSAINDYLKMYFNSDTTDSNYLLTFGYGDSQSNVGSYTRSAAQRHVGDFPATNASGNVFGIMNIYIMNYSTSSETKTVLSWGNSGNNAAGSIGTIDSMRWTGTSPITSVTFTPGVGTNIVTNSVASLYGVKNS